MTTATLPVRENNRFRKSAEDICRWPSGATSVAPTMSWPMITETEMSVVGRESNHGYLDSEEITRIVRGGLAPLPVDGRRVLVLIPDGTRTMPMPLMFEALE